MLLRSHQSQSARRLPDLTQILAEKKSTSRTLADLSPTNSDSLKTKVWKCDTKVSAAKTNDRSLPTTASLLETKFKTLETGISDLEVKVSLLETKVKSFETKVSGKPLKTSHLQTVSKRRKMDLKAVLTQFAGGWFSRASR